MTEILSFPVPPGTSKRLNRAARESAQATRQPGGRKGNSAKVVRLSVHLQIVNLAHQAEALLSQIRSLAVQVGRKDGGAA